MPSACWGWWERGRGTGGGADQMCEERSLESTFAGIALLWGYESNRYSTSETSNLVCVHSETWHTASQSYSCSMLTHLGITAWFLMWIFVSLCQVKFLEVLVHSGKSIFGIRQEQLSIIYCIQAQAAHTAVSQDSSHREFAACFFRSKAHICFSKTTVEQRAGMIEADDQSIDTNYMIWQDINTDLGTSASRMSCAEYMLPLWISLKHDLQVSVSIASKLVSPSKNETRM